MARVVGIIAEYNPFHSGHARQIAHIREEGEARVVAVMSGNFVQRGEAALFDKYVRAKAALSCGVDLVVELPFPYACARARDFAAMGVKALEALGCVEELCFGAERADLGLLCRAAAALDNPAVGEETRRLGAQGLTYARARRLALEKVLGEGAALFDGPNNTLAVEYLRALAHSGSPIQPRALPREGAGHGSLRPEGGTASGQALRGMHRAGEGWGGLVPPAALACYRGQPDFLLERGEAAALWQLRQMQREDFAALPDVSEGLENRLWEAAGVCTGMADFLARVKTKRYPLARLRRILLHALLGVKREDFTFSLPYLKVLGFTEGGKALLGRGKVPILSKGVKIEALSEEAARLHRQTARTTDFFSLLAPVPRTKGEEYRGKIVKV
ncbi:MAG: nucleotidyltransferase family protein [Oscillospiraceae bacterium]|jgi:predicted nucleotidyltransferase|nr:nucleotidyltransferase family protein [Oscillospiraceae bacterium]